MSYSTSNPPRCIAQGIGGTGKLWLYKSTDAESTFDDTDYFTNAVNLGMVTGDCIIIIDSTNGLTTIAQVTTDADGNATVSALTATS